MVHGGVFITGAASGIGRAWALRLARKNYGITVVDLDIKGAEETVGMIKALGGSAQAVKCDLTSYGDQKHAYEAHIREFQTLDYAILNAGVPEQGDFLDPNNTTWDLPLNVLLEATLIGIRQAGLIMEVTGTKGTICVTASDLAVKENSWFAPCYAAAKAGLLHFVWTMADKFQKDYGIRLCALCPARAETPLVQSGYFFETGPLCDTGTEPALTAEEVAEAGMTLIEQPEKTGKAVLLESSKQLYALTFPTVNVKALGKVEAPIGLS